MDAHAPKVSVLISAFRRPEFLNQALDSVYSQTFKDFEVIVVDDGSGEEFTSNYSLRADTRFVCHSEPGRGSSCVRNSGTRVARGRYIAYLDDDDVWLPDKLEKQVCILDENLEVGLTYCHHTLVDENLRQLESQPVPKPVSGDCLRLMLRRNLVKSPSCVLVRRAVLDQCGPFDERLKVAEDWEMWTRVSLYHAIHADPAPLVLYRVHSSQISGDRTIMRQGEVDVRDRWLDWARRERPGWVGFLRRMLSIELGRLSGCQRRDGDRVVALRTLKRAAQVYPLNPRTYLRILTTLPIGSRGTSAEIPEPPIPGLFR